MFGEHCGGPCGWIVPLRGGGGGSSVQIWKSDFILNSLNDKADLMRSVL